MGSLWRTLTRPVYIPLADKAEDAYHAFSRTGRGVFIFLASVMVVSSVALLYILNSSMLTATPGYGGSLVEGIIGSPRFINPVLAISDADHDLSILVYSGLLRATPEGDYVPDLASSYEVSSDGTTYTFHLRPNATFHDGTKVTADDVVFTIQKIQDAALKSPARADWVGVTVSEPDPETVQFTLKSRYAPFIQNLTVGILPKHLWANVSDEEFPFSDLNTQPVGSGPFKVGRISRSPSGIPSSYELDSNSAYALGAPYLSQIDLHFYQNESDLADALARGDVEAASGLSPASLTDIKDATIKTAPLNRVFGVFFNQNQSEVLRDHDVRQALSDAINQQDLVNQVLGGYGTPLTGPVPPELLDATTTATKSPSAAAGTTTDIALLAQQELIKQGWTLDSNGVLTKTTGTGKNAKTETLAFSLSTSDVPELRAAAEYLRRQWDEMGAQVDVKIFEQGDLSQNVIRPRKYDALLFGEVIGRELDLYAFWDSSQRNDPGLNVALYANSTADKILEQLRQTTDTTMRQNLYSQFLAQFNADIPAVFLYAPDFVYSIPNDIQGLDLGFIETPSDRFLSAPEWHRETDYVWPIFNSKQ
ncbi:MAG TPA: peptide ABC transporter substrate-binding protein [Candidatus Paceibacterota bacterium]|nr:peptide ABC transporter substrate-binding protein [Candidatus Paceibacterota bacterium]